MQTINFDNAATTRVSDAVAREMAWADAEMFYNSAALYSASLSVKRELTHANEIVRRKISPGGGGEVVFTSGATESNNMVILGKVSRKTQHVLVMAGEHSSVFAPAKYLKDEGFDVEFVPLLRDGTVDMDAVKRLVRPSTAIFAFGMVNSDTGTVQDIAGVVRVVRAINKAVHIHLDAAQGFCKFDFDAYVLGVDSCSVSAHKINGPKGIGALWLRKGVKLTPLMFGGGQQSYRPGTENNAGVLGFAKAVETFDTHAAFNHVGRLHARLITKLPAGCTVNGRNENPYITNIQLPGVLGQTVVNALSGVGIFAGLGSACASTATKNRTLLAMGIPEAKTKQVLRVSFGVTNTLQEVDTFCAELGKVLDNLGGL